jgi:hypothetical protein
MNIHELLNQESKIPPYPDFIRMTDAESKSFADKSMEEITDAELLSDTLLHLAVFTNGNCLKTHYEKLVEKKLFYPGEIYRHADENIAAKMISLLETNYATVNVNHLLICLAWIGAPNVVDFFIASNKQKPAWAKSLHVLPMDYVEEAGWTIDAKNQKKNLFSEKTIPLTAKNQELNSESGIRTFIPSGEKCKWCENTLTTVFEIHAMEFTACLSCSCYGPFYMKLNESGKSSWHPKNDKPEYLPENREMEMIPENTLRVSSEKRLPGFTISQFTAISKSQIGGYPTWVDDANYLNCVDCNQKMQYIGQADRGEFEKYGEGTYYFHHCAECKTTGTNYQQT